MKKNTRNAEYTKEYNRKSLLRYLRNENLSRAELSRRMGLSRAAISIIAEELLNEGMVAETAAVESRVGRTPVPLMLLPEAGYAIGVFLNRTDTLAGLVDICGTVLEQTKIPPEMLEGKDRMEILSGIIMDLIRRSGVDRERIVGIGISAPGPLDGEKGIILNPPHFEQWYRSPIGPELQKRTGYPVYLENDASCLARYNLGKPEARGSEDYLLLMVEKGVGSGVISRGHVLKGAGYFTSELGHTSIDYQGRLCSCGNRGCLEMYASLENLLAGSPFRDWRELIDSLETSPEARELLEQEAEYLSTGISNFISVVPVDTVLLAGEILYGVKKLIPVLEEKTKRRVFRESDSLNLRFLPSRMGENARLLAAADVAFGRYLMV